MREYSNRRELMKMVGRWCKRLRRDNHVKQRELAEELGLTQAGICRFELGQSDSVYIAFNYIERFYPMLWAMMNIYFEEE